MAVSRPGIKPAPIFSDCSAHYVGQPREETPDAAHRAGLAHLWARTGVPMKTQAE